MDLVFCLERAHALSGPPVCSMRFPLGKRAVVMRVTRFREEGREQCPPIAQERNVRTGFFATAVIQLATKWICRALTWFQYVGDDTVDELLYGRETVQLRKAVVLHGVRPP